ncbi:MAG: protein phosphatase 2C domain-containing protein [Blastocatellia bacterium]|nr:protein phosphatase 2C domain-containing protein [Blastocatellia bacterium]
MKVTVGQITDKGLNPKRTVNEDNLLAMPEAGLFLVADGVGGRLGGEVASRTVVEVFSRVFSQQHSDDLRQVIENAIDLCNQKIYEDQQSDPELDGMATTIALVAVTGNRAVVAHVGDSRVYRFDEQGLICLTQDHSEVGDALRAGMITPEQAAKHPRRNVISRAIGADIDVEPDFREIEVDDNTSFILCSDGINRHIADEEIARLMQGGQPPQTICGHMKDLCYRGGAEDNLTAIIVDYGERQYAEEQTKPRIPASVVQAQIAEAAEAAEAAPAKQRFEVSLKPPAPQRQSGPLKMPTGALPDAAGDGATAPATAAKGTLRQAMGTKEITFKVPTVRMPKKEEMSKVMKISLLATALIAGIVLGVLLAGPVARIFNSLTGDPYKVRNIKQTPTDPDIAAAYALHLEGRTNDAREALTKFLTSNPTSPEAHFYIGRINADEKKFDDAIRHLKQATEIDPTMSDAWSNLAFAYLAVGQKSNAMDCLQRAIKLDSGSARPESSPEPPTSAPTTSPKPVG